MRKQTLAAGLFVTMVLGSNAAVAAATCNPTRLESDMLCCLAKTCDPNRPGHAQVEGAVRAAPNNQTLWSLRQGFKKCQQTDEFNNFLACERNDKKGPYNLGRRILGLPPG